MTTTDLALRPDPDDPAIYRPEELESVERYAFQSVPDGTRRAYESAWREWQAWCSERGYSDLPGAPLAIAAFVADLADRGDMAATIQRKLSAISRVHRDRGIDPPPTRDVVVQRVMKGIRRQLGVAPVHHRDPLTAAELHCILDTLPAGTAAGLRDRALLLIGFYGAYRRSELVGFDVADVSESIEGLTLILRRSKTDQDGEGEVKGLPRQPDPGLCPVRALTAWRAAAAITEGALWRRLDRNGDPTSTRLTAQSVALIVKRACSGAGVDPARYAGHSLRSGFVTSAAARGVSEQSIMRQTGHRSQRMVRRYIRHGSVFIDNAASRVHL